MSDSTLLDLPPEDKADLDHELARANRQYWDPTIEELQAWGVKGADTFRAKLEAVLVPMIDRAEKASELARIYTMLRQISEAMNEATDVMSTQYKRLGQELIPEFFEREKITSFNTSDGYRVTTTVALRTSIIADQKSDAHDWLKANGLEALITQTVNANTLSSAGKTFAEEGRELPEDLFHQYYQNNTSITKIQRK